MLTVITFKWSTPGYRSKYDATHVNTMQRMVARHYPHPHRFVCITDDPTGVECETWPLWDDLASVPNPTWPDRGPSCYRRLKLFACPSIGRWAWLDLDVVITGDLSPLWNRPEPVVTYTPPGLNGGINGAMILCNEPERFRFVWDLFDPDVSPKETTRLGYRGSDQAWLTACLQHCSGKWGEADGCYDYSGLRKPAMRMGASGSARRQVNLPDGARIVFFHGKPDPWEVDDSWVLDNYKCLSDSVGAGSTAILLEALRRLMTDNQEKTFNEAVRHVIKWLNENKHPHCAVIITPTCAELLDGVMCTGPVLDYVKG